jgi:hypothetical protein
MGPGGGVNTQPAGVLHELDRGRTVCPNDLVVPMAVADDGVLTAFEDQVLNPAALQRAIQGALTDLERREDARPGQAAAELVTVQAQLDRLAEAIALGGQPRVLVEKIQTLERRRCQVARGECTERRSGTWWTARPV